jgi:hypothetical protein
MAFMDIGQRVITIAIDVTSDLFKCMFVVPRVLFVPRHPFTLFDFIISTHLLNLSIHSFIGFICGDWNLCNSFPMPYN